MINSEKPVAVAALVPEAKAPMQAAGDKFVTKLPPWNGVGVAHQMNLPAKPASTGNALQDEIQSLKFDYVSRGGKDSAMLEAISALERQALVPQARAWGGGRMLDPAHIAGARAVQGVYSSQWPGVPAGAGMYGGWGAAVPAGTAPIFNTSSGYSMAQAGDDLNMRSMQQEMAKMDAALEERKRENSQLSQQLQQMGAAKSPSMRNQTGETNATGRATVANELGRHLTEEEEELMEMEANPKDTELYRLRKKHLKEMVVLKYDMQRLKQETEKDEMEQQVGMMKKEHERREWVLKQQQQLLEAKYRKHMAREKPFTNVGEQTENRRPKDAADYSPDVGFHMYVDYILGLPSKVNNQVQIVYGFYEGIGAKTDPKSMPMCGVESDGAGLRAVVAVKRSFLKVAANNRFKVLIELQNVLPATADRGPRTMPVGWTMVRLFQDDGDFNRGLWRVPMFLPPVRPDFAPEDLVNVHRIKHLEIFLRFVVGQQADVHDRFSVNPDMTQMQYKYPKELKLKEPEKRVENFAPMPLQQGPVAKLALPGQPAPLVGAGPQAMLTNLANMPSLLPHEAAGSIAPAAGSIEASLLAPTTPLLLEVHDVSGTLFGHGHCQESGPIFVRVSLVLQSTGQLINSTITAHTNAAVSSPGLRVMEVVEEGQEAQQVMKQVQASWCTSAVFSGDASFVTWAQGITLELVPCHAGTALLLEVYRESQGAPDMQALNHAQAMSTVRQNPDEHSTLIAWATIALFARSGIAEPVAEDEERSEWSKVGLRVLTGVQERALLAPPVSHATDYDTLRLQQAKYADVLSCDGLATTSGGATVILNAPLPTLRVSIDLPQKPVLDRFGRAADGTVPAGLPKPNGKSERDSIFKYTDTEAWIPAPDPPLSNELFAADDGFDIYIDAARWLPDNVTVSTVTCYVANDKMQLYGKLDKEMDARSMNVRCPYFLARKEMRKDPSKDWDPTLTLLVQVNGLEGNPADYVKSEKDAQREKDKAQKEGRVLDFDAPLDMDSSQDALPIAELPCVIVGFAVLNLFVDPLQQEQPADRSVREYVLNEGSFQLSLHRSGLKEKEDLSVHALDDEMRRLCCTLLVRIVKAPRSVDGTKVLSVKDYPGVDEDELENLNLLLKPEAYHLQGYASSRFCYPYEMEQVLYPQRLKAQTNKMLSAAESIMGLMGKRLSVEDEDAVEACLTAFDPEHFNDTLKVLRGFVKKLFRNKAATRTLDAKLSILYMPHQGFLVSVDGVDNMTQVSSLARALSRSLACLLVLSLPGAHVRSNSLPPPLSISLSLSLSHTHTHKLTHPHAHPHPLTQILSPFIPPSLTSFFPCLFLFQDFHAVWTGAMTSTIPQAMYYKTDGDVGSDVTVFYQMDFQADARSPRWTDGWMWYTQRDASHGRMVVVIDVRMIVTEAKVGRKFKKIKNKQVVQLGFAFLPVIGPAGNYILSGNYRLPLYAMGANPVSLELDHADQLKPSPWGPSLQVFHIYYIHACYHMHAHTTHKFPSVQTLFVGALLKGISNLYVDNLLQTNT